MLVYMNSQTKVGIARQHITRKTEAILKNSNQLICNFLQNHEKIKVMSLEHFTFHGTQNMSIQRTAQQILIFPTCEMVCSTEARSMPFPPMPWLHASACHQQPLYWTFHTVTFLTFSVFFSNATFIWNNTFYRFRVHRYNCPIMTVCCFNCFANTCSFSTVTYISVEESQWGDNS